MSSVKNRLGGVGLFLLGAFVTYIALIQPALDASAGAAEISVSFKGILLGPCLAVWGLMLAAFGDLIVRDESDQPKLTLPGWVTLVVSLVLTLGVGFGAWQYFTSMGYQF